MILKRYKWLIIVILLLLGACSPRNIPANALSTGEGSPTGHSSSASEVVILTDTPEPSPTLATPPTATFTPAPSPTETPASTSTTVAVTPACINRATLVRHLSFADGSSIINGLFFGKSWRIQNTGTCTWTTSYAFVFASGEQMSAPAETLLTRDVPPGDTIDIQILMEAPDVANAYTGNWMLRDPNGALFGIGDIGDQPIVIKIVVKYDTNQERKYPPECG
jgi:hypothetical protein